MESLNCLDCSNRLIHVSNGTWCDSNYKAYVCPNCGLQFIDHHWHRKTHLESVNWAYFWRPSLYRDFEEVKKKMTKPPFKARVLKETSECLIMSPISGDKCSTEYRVFEGVLMAKALRPEGKR